MPSAGAPDLVAIWDAHTDAEFARRDPDAAVAVMTEDTMIVHVPLGIGGVGKDAVRDFYASFLTAQVPDDLGLEVLTRTIEPDRLVDEFLVHFTHTVQMDWFAPGIPPTGRALDVRHVAVVGFRDGLICSEHIYWDNATVLVQLGVLDPRGLPTLGAEQAARFAAPTFLFEPAGPA